MSKIRIDFCDFGFNVSKTNNFFHRVLSERFDLELCDQPDFLIYSAHGYEHRMHSGVRIFFSGESAAPDYRHCDYSVTARKMDDPRHLQLPFYALYGSAEDILKGRDDPAKILAAKTRFCSFVVRSHNPRLNRNRLAFFQRLSKYKPVDSGGEFRNNIGGAIPRPSRGEIQFLRAFKFHNRFVN